MNHVNPGDSEIAKRVYEALSAIEAGDCWIAVTEHYWRDRADLRIDDDEEFWALVSASLCEIKKQVPWKCYAGHRPPDVSGEPRITGQKLWAFCWCSDVWTEKLSKEYPDLVWDRKMYLKFVILKSGKRPEYAHVDIHRSRP